MLRCDGALLRLKSHALLLLLRIHEVAFDEICNAISPPSASVREIYVRAARRFDAQISFLWAGASGADGCHQYPTIACGMEFERIYALDFGAA